LTSCATPLAFRSVPVRVHLIDESIGAGGQHIDQVVDGVAIEQTSV
jgi:hypothetical protein